MGNNIVSIITPTYNCGNYIAETIASVISQTYNNWEMIIVDDCSTDNTQQIVEAYTQKDQRIRYHRLSVNSGAAVARTIAMKLAKGHYMAFLDSDDLWEPNKLERQLAFMIQHNYAFSCTSYCHINQEGKLLDKIIYAKKKVNYNRLLLDCPVGNSTVMYDVEAMGKFEVPNIRKRNDDALWLKMLKVEKYIWGMPDVLMKYRIRPNSISTNKFDLIRYHWSLYRDVEHLNVFRSIFHVGYWCFLKVFHLK